MSLTTKIAAAALTAAVPLALAAAPAEAGSRWTERSSGSFADTTWLEMGELPGGVAGNAHVGFLRVEGDKSPWVYGEITDWTCPDGVLPPMFGGGHGEEPPETECVLESQRSLYNAGPVTLTVDRKLNRATLTGPLEVADHEGGGATGQPMANITWTGVGGTGTARTTTSTPTRRATASRCGAPRPPARAPVRHARRDGLRRRRRRPVVRVLRHVQDGVDVRQPLTAASQEGGARPVWPCPARLPGAG